jgi:hypothetical protein
MLCALAFSAIAAQGASASKGTTAFTCKEKKEKGGAGFSKAHCKPGDAVGSGASFEHVAVAPGTATEISGTNKNTGSNTNEATQVQLRAPSAGIDYELSVGVVEGVGSVTNATTETGEHYVHGVATITFKEVTVTKPSGKGCVVKGGIITTNELKATTQGQGDFLKFEPNAGEVLTSYTIEGCSTTGVNGVYEVKGSIKCPVEGATVTCTHSDTTTQGTLSDRGQKAGVAGTMTLSAKELAAGDEAFTPLSVTTVETP